MIKMIAMDLDGTALRSDSSVSEAVQAALHAAAEAGIVLVLASGRPYRALPELLYRFPGVRYAVVSNGAAVYSLPDGKRLHGCCVPMETAQVVAQFAQQEQLTLEAFWNGQGFAAAAYVQDPARYGRSGKFATYVRTTRCGCADLRLVLSAGGGLLDSLALVCPDPERKADCMQRLQILLPEAYITTSGGDLLEIMAGDARKAVGVAFAAQHCGILPGEIAAFGNGDNDADMLSYAAIGVAMEDASELCRAAAQWIVPSSDADGMAEGIARILAQNAAASEKGLHHGYRI